VQNLEFDSKITSVLHVPDNDLIISTNNSLITHDLEKETRTTIYKSSKKITKLDFNIERKNNVNLPYQTLYKTDIIPRRKRLSLKRPPWKRLQIPHRKRSRSPAVNTFCESK